MKWNRQTIKTVVIVFLIVVLTLFFIRWTFDHDGETIEIGGDRAYTVLTPGSPDGGARRIITGDGAEFYWTEDHYESFERIHRRNT